MYVGKIVEGQKYEDLSAKLEGYKDRMYVQNVGEATAFMAIRKREYYFIQACKYRGWERIVEKLYSMNDILISLEDWKHYVQGQKCILDPPEVCIADEAPREKRRKRYIPEALPGKGPGLPAYPAMRPGFFVCFAPMYTMPRASLYWHLIQAQCYFTHNSLH